MFKCVKKMKLLKKLERESKNLFDLSFNRNLDEDTQDKIYHRLECVDVAIERIKKL